MSALYGVFSTASFRMEQCFLQPLLCPLAFLDIPSLATSYHTFHTLMPVTVSEVLVLHLSQD